MYLFHIFHSFLPLRNTIGFGASDFIVFAITALLVLCALARPLLKPYGLKIVASMRWSILLLATLPVVLRLMLLPRYPAPGPILVVLLPAPLFCVLCYWMLRGWTTAVWALFGGLLCVFKFGPLSPWMNSDSNGLPAAIAGCLVFGVLPRLLKIRVKGFPLAAQILVSLCVAQFLFWYGLHLCAPAAVITAMGQYETWP